MAMATYPGLMYLCLAGAAAFAALLCVACTRELRMDAGLWLAVAVVGSSMYAAARAGLIP